MNHSSRQIAAPMISAIRSLSQYIDVPQNALGPTGRISRCLTRYFSPHLEARLVSSCFYGVAPQQD